VFFSSRRRHTRLVSDWSSDVCSSDLPASLVWFEIPADDLKRAQKFYSALFGWKINPFPNMQDYWHIDSGGDDASPDGAIMKRMRSEERRVGKEWRWRWAPDQ